MIRSPGAALSIAVWMALSVAFGPVTYVGALPAIVTVTVSIDCLPLAAVMTSWAQRAEVPVLVGTVRWLIAHVDTADWMTGTVPVMVVSLHVTFVRGWDTPSLPTRAAVPAVLANP